MFRMYGKYVIYYYMHLIILSLDINMYKYECLILFEIKYIIIKVKIPFGNVIMSEQDFC